MASAPVISCGDWGSGCFLGIFPVIILNQDFEDFQDYRGRRRFKFGGYSWIRDARVFSPTGFNLIFTCFHLVLNQDLQDFQDYRGRLCFKFVGYL